jgi:hypothetical protein
MQIITTLPCNLPPDFRRDAEKDPRGAGGTQKILGLLKIKAKAQFPHLGPAKLSSYQ